MKNEVRVIDFLLSRFKNLGYLFGSICCLFCENQHVLNSFQGGQIGHLDKVISPLVLILLKMNGYVKAFKVKNGDKDKNIKLMSFLIDNEKL